MSLSGVPDPSQPSRFPPAGEPAGATLGPLAPHLPIPDLAQVVHEATASLHQDLVVLVRTTPNHLELAVWPVPHPGPSTIDVLVGWRPDPGLRAVGLVSTGEEHGPERQGPVALTVLTDTDGHSATVLERPHGDPLTLVEEPTGWGADALRRTLGLPTPPPQHPVSAYVDAVWLGFLASEVWPAEAGRPTTLGWDQVARLHPLAEPDGPSRRPHELAQAARSMDRSSSWSRLLQALALDRAGAVQPPGGRSVPLTAWFDQGSFSRWMLRSQPDPDHVLFDLLDHLTDEAADRLLEALVSL